MKTTILLLTLLFNSLFLGATSEIKLTFINPVTFDPIEEVEVTVFSEKGLELGKGTSDAKGIFIISLERLKKKSTVHLKIRHVDEMYVSKDMSILLGKGKSNTQVINLAPSTKLYDQWYAADDEKYGNDKARSLSPELNNDDLICGCSVFTLEEATFIGGQEEMYKFIQTTLRYPQESIENNEQGKVYVNFIIEEDGQVSHIKIEKGVTPLLDAEAYRVVKSMYLWDAAFCNGENVRMVVRLPFNFTLD